MVEYTESHLDAIFMALGDPTRRQMLRRLSQGNCTVSELAAPFDMSLAGASKHVRMLENAGLIHRTVQGRTHVCSLQTQALSEAQQWLQFYEQFWSDRLDALARELESHAKPTRRK